MMQAVRVMLAARKLTRLARQASKRKSIPWSSWGRGQMMLIIMGVAFLIRNSEAYTNKCGCPPSLTTCGNPSKLPVQCYCAEEAYFICRTEKTCLQWQINALEPLTYPPTLKPLGNMYIKGNSAVNSERPTLLSQGYCPLKHPLPSRKVHLGYIAGLTANSTVDHIYAHPHFGLIGVNTTTHARARFGAGGTYLQNYQQYVPQCHCYVKLEAPTANGWTRFLDDWTLWVGVKTRNGHSTSPPIDWEYVEKSLAYKRSACGEPLFDLKTPRPPEKLLFQRHADYRILNFLNITENYPASFGDFKSLTWEESRRVHYDDKAYLSEKDLPPRATPPELVHHLFTGVMHYLADHMSVTMECSMDIMSKPAVLGFNQLPNEQNTLTIAYNLMGYAVSWKEIGPVLRNRPNCGGRIACTFTPGTPRPSSVGPAYFWVHLDRPLNHTVNTPPQKVAPNNPLTVVYSTPEDTDPLQLGGKNETGALNRSKLKTNEAASFHPLRDFPAMWGQNCEKKRIDQKCNQTLVEIETKMRYDESFYDPYQNRSLVPDSTQTAIFFPQEHTRETRQVFAAIAIVTAFAIQGVVDYAGYKRIQGVEQELNDEMNTRAKANNKRFRQADNAIGRLSRQI